MAEWLAETVKRRRSELKRTRHTIVHDLAQTADREGGGRTAEWLAETVKRRQSELKRRRHTIVHDRAQTADREGVVRWQSG